MPRNWHYERHDEALIGDLCRSLKVSPLLAQVLIARGYQDPEHASKFLNSRLSKITTSSNGMVRESFLMMTQSSASPFGFSFWASTIKGSNIRQMRIFFFI